MKYKFANKENTAVNDNEKNLMNITIYSRFWQEYQDWLAEGNVTEPYQTIEEELNEALNKKIGEILMMNDAKDKEPIPFKGELFKNTNAVTETIKVCEMMGQQDNDPLFVNGGYWDNFDGSISVPFTFKDLKDLYTTGYMKCAVHYAVAKYHIDTVKSFSTPEEILNYDITVGWDGSILKN
jgi:hypothetical protein